MTDLLTLLLPNIWTLIWAFRVFIKILLILIVCDIFLLSITIVVEVIGIKLLESSFIDILLLLYPFLRRLGLWLQLWVRLLLKKVRLDVIIHLCSFYHFVAYYALICILLSWHNLWGKSFSQFWLWKMIQQILLFVIIILNWLRLIFITYWWFILIIWLVLRLLIYHLKLSLTISLFLFCWLPYILRS